MMKNIVSSFSLTLSVIWLILILGSSFPSEMEGKLFPVVQNVNFTYNENGAIVSFDKNRNCDLHSFDWYLSSEDKSTSVKIEARVNNIVYSDENSIILAVDMPSQNVSDYTKISVNHVCHPFWQTTTIIK